MIHETVIIVSADTGILQRLIVLLLKAVAFLCYVFLATATFGMLRLAIKLLKPFYRGKCKSHPRKQFYSRSAISITLKVKVADLKESKSKRKVFYILTTCIIALSKRI